MRYCSIRPNQIIKICEICKAGKLIIQSFSSAHPTFSHDLIRSPVRTVTYLIIFKALIYYLCHWFHVHISATKLILPRHCTSVNNKLYKFSIFFFFLRNALFIGKTAALFPADSQIVLIVHCLIITVISFFTG